MKDPEAEVRTAACSQIPGWFYSFKSISDCKGFCALIDPAIVLREVIPCVKELVMDGSQHVRSAMALHVTALAPIVGKNEYVPQLV